MAGLTPKQERFVQEYLQDLNVTAAYKRAIWGLAASPQSIPFLKERLKPVPAVNPERVARLIANLDDDTFAVREQASRELAALGPSVEAALRKALQGSPPPERMRRVAELLDKLKAGSTAPERLQATRAVEALEHSGTAEARQLLEALAKGAPEASLTQEAKEGLERLNRRAH